MNNLLTNETIIYITIRILQSLGNLWLVSFLSFGLIQLAPGSYCEQFILQDLNVSIQMCQDRVN